MQTEELVLAREVYGASLRNGREEHKEKRLIGEQTSGHM